MISIYEHTIYADVLGNLTFKDCKFLLSPLTQYQVLPLTTPKDLSINVDLHSQTFGDDAILGQEKERGCLMNPRASLSMWTHFCRTALHTEPNFFFFFFFFFSCQEKNKKS